MVSLHKLILTHSKQSVEGGSYMHALKHLNKLIHMELPNLQVVLKETVIWSGWGNNQFNSEPSAPIQPAENPVNGTQMLQGWERVSD